MLIPCIDLQNGMAVQLVHGRKRELAITDVLGVLEKFKNYEWLHIIDLDAAMGKTSNAKLAQKLCFTARSALWDESSDRRRNSYRGTRGEGRWVEAGTNHHRQRSVP